MSDISFFSKTLYHPFLKLLVDVLQLLQLTGTVSTFWDVPQGRYCCQLDALGNCTSGASVHWCSLLSLAPHDNGVPQTGELETYCHSFILSPSLKRKQLANPILDEGQKGGI